MSSIRIKALSRLSAVRLTAWLFGLFALISLIAWGGTYLLVQREMGRTVDARLTDRMQAAIAALDAGRPPPAVGDGQTIDIVETAAPDGFTSVDLGRPGPDMRYLLKTTEHGRLRIGENVERQEELREILAGGMQLSLLATLIAAGLAGFWMARRGQSRLNVINAALASVAQGRLDARIALDGRDDLSLLADRINATTARLEDAVGRMRVQSSNIAHDLRTPLARLRAQIETSLVDVRDRGRRVEPAALTAALAQIDQITGTFEALLRLAQIESGAGRAAFTRVDLAALAERVEETFGPVVEDAGQSLVVQATDAATVDGDEALLIQLLANLIQNALRHGAGGRFVTLEVRGARLAVSDEGPGVPPSERENVLQPLYRSEPARQGEGFGLGLSLVRAIADMHGAALSLSDGRNGRGLTVSLDFPKLTKL